MSRDPLRGTLHVEGPRSIPAIIGLTKRHERGVSCSIYLSLGYARVGTT